MTTREENIYKNLSAQVDKIARHTRQGSFKTRERYKDATNSFCKFIAVRFGVQKFANIKDKHIEAYVRDMEDRGLFPSTIKTNLSGIRYFYDQSGAKNILSGNEKFDIDKRSFGGVERAWSYREHKTFLNVCDLHKRPEIACISILGRGMGLRIHEAMRLDRNDVNKAIKTGELRVKGKGGLIRTVPVPKDVRGYLSNYIGKNNPTGKVFVAEHEKTHLKIKQVQNYINRHRDKFQDTDSEVNRTFHGLRHAYAYEQYQGFRESGLNDYEARKEVSLLLGHERDEVTRIYLPK